LSARNDLALHENITDYANQMNLEEEKHSGRKLQSEGELLNLFRAIGICYLNCYS
jgi:hypothetical protein